MDPKMFDEIFGKSNKDNSEENFYAILGCDPSSTKEQIQAEYKIRALELHPDKGSTDSKKFLLLQKAKETLTDEDKRLDYDRWRNSGLCVSYKRWSQMNSDGLHSSFHWRTTSAKNKPALTNTDTNKHSTNSDSHQTNFPLYWNTSKNNPTKNTMLDRFRKYEI